MPVFIGITGGTATGKTTVSRIVADKLQQHWTCSILSQDNYYEHIPPGTDTSSINFDIPEAIRWSEMMDHIKCLADGNIVQIKKYNYETIDVNDIVTIHPSDAYIIEGTLIFTQKPLLDLCTLRVFINCDEQKQYTRKIARDISERGKSFAASDVQWREFARPMQSVYVLPIKNVCDLIIDDCSIEVGASAIYNCLRHLLLMSQCDAHTVTDIATFHKNL